MRTVYICEEASIAKQLQLETPTTSSRHINLNGVPIAHVTLTERSDHKYRNHILEQILSNQTGSIMTLRFAAEASIPVHQPRRNIWIPWCSDKIFLNWLFVLTGRSRNIYPQYFFMKCRLQNKMHIPKNHFLAVLEGISQMPDHLMSVPNLAALFGLSDRQLRKSFPQYFGVSPGKLLRAIVLFRQTLALMDEEHKIEQNGNKRHGQSPLARLEIETNFNFSERLKRLIGIEYRELLSAAQNDHWATLWMKKWREAIAAKHLD